MMRRAVWLLVCGAVVSALSWAVAFTMKPTPQRSGQAEQSATGHEPDFSRRVFVSPTSSDIPIPAEQEGLTETQRVHVAPALEVLGYLEKRGKTVENAELLERVEGERAKLLAVARKIQGSSSEGERGR